jgi:CRP/FNR family transcriptional regulator, anaerobic regulatory protein
VKTARERKTAQVGVAPRVTALHSVGIESAPLRLKLALEQVEDLELRLASSQHESTAAQQQLAAVTKANVQLRKLMGRHEHEFAWGGSPAALSRSFTDSRSCAGLDSDATQHFDHLLAARSRYRKGDGLYYAGESFKALFAISTGSCKTVLLTRDGQAQVTGYHLAGEIIGFDGIDTETHECQAIALEDMEVFTLPFDELENLARLNRSFGHTLHIWLSHEGARIRTLTIVLGTMRAEQRLAAFLLDLSHRYQEGGYSSCEFVLRMTREEIGSYLGLKLETVSRLLSRFQRDSLIQVEGRLVRLRDRVALRGLVDGRN